MRATALSAIALAFCLTMASAPDAGAGVQDYQIRRLLNDRSACRPLSLSLQPDHTASALRYHAECADAALYPDGVEIACGDRQDERSCRILNPAKTFRTPNLQPSGPAPGW